MGEIVCTLCGWNGFELTKYGCPRCNEFAGILDKKECILAYNEAQKELEENYKLYKSRGWFLDKEMLNYEREKTA